MTGVINMDIDRKLKRHDRNSDERGCDCEDNSPLTKTVMKEDVTVKTILP